MEERREVRFYPAKHRCSSDRSKDYGINEPRIVWALYVDDEAITWELHTGWGMPDEAFHAACPDCTHRVHRNGWPSSKPTGGSVDWHLATPAYDDQHCVDNCVVRGGRCYADVGYLIGDELFDLLRVEGDESVWDKMRELLLTYRDAFVD